MAFYGPTFPNEVHNEALLNARQRFGNKSANMFFVRPARHIACPRRLKYIHDITTGYIPYVEDSNAVNPSSYKYMLRKLYNDDMNKISGLGYSNSTDSWRQQLMELAQQVKTSLTSVDEQESQINSSATYRSNKNRFKRNRASLLNTNIQELDEQAFSKRLQSRHGTPRYQSPKIGKSKSNSKSEQEQPGSDDSQDSGIWLIPLLCYILRIDNVIEAQDWLMNANPTEKRLAKELISRTMKDMQNDDNDFISDASTSDISSTMTSFNNVYWPCKLLQRQEKERQQHLIQNLPKQCRTPIYSSLPSLGIDSSHQKCERGSSPLRIVTPAKQLSTALSTSIPSTEKIIIERLPTQNTNERAKTAMLSRENQSEVTDRAASVNVRQLVRNPTPLIITNGNDLPSRRTYRVKTSITRSTDDDTDKKTHPFRGKSPLV